MTLPSPPGAGQAVAGIAHDAAQPGGLFGPTGPGQFLDQALGRLIARGTPFSLMHVDLDFFKVADRAAQWLGLGGSASDLRRWMDEALMGDGARFRSGAGCGRRFACVD